jgi:hypothetical protein
MDRECIPSAFRVILIISHSFRWLDCQLQTLRKCATPAAVQKILSDLPKSLEAYYTSVLENVEECNRVSVKNLLRWVAFALRPVSMLSIYLQVDSGSTLS